jgi:hypothetical protein
MVVGARSPLNRKLKRGKTGVSLPEEKELTLGRNQEHTSTLSFQTQIAVLPEDHKYLLCTLHLLILPTQIFKQLLLQS